MSIVNPAAGTVLTLKRPPHVPLEAELLSPDTFVGLDHAGIRSLPVMLGKRQYRLDDFFHVDGSGGERIEIRGDVGRVKWIGRGMSRGRISIDGNAGMHLGAYMKGGVITVSGHASDWVGAEMRGGTIHVHGDAGGQIGAAYRGSLTGMNGGTIVIDGSAGMEVGMRMRRGLIAIKGKVRDFAGLQMKGGTIVLQSGGELRTGAWMVRGTIISLVALPLLPTFTFACRYQPTFLRIYARFLEPFGVKLPIEAREGSYCRYVGDWSVPGKGEVLVWQGATMR
ncbi:MAG: formylmethanofuran dehydrogenase subunit C [Gemmataceae bacterium]|nr:formylmethanofuran dehydrogenase subunit C [Gemmataceae bacterium]